MKQLVTPKRFLRLGTRAGLMLVLGALLAMGISAVVSAHGGDPQHIHACVNDSNGIVRIASAPGFECPPGWSALEWDIAGLPDDDWTRDGPGSMYPTNLDDNVGIGTTEPGSPLEVVKNTLALESTIAINSTLSGGQQIIDFQYLGEPQARIRHAIGGGLHIGTLANTEFQLSTNDQIRILIQNDGKVGIGTIFPQSTLHVSGFVQLDLTVDTPPTIDCDETTERGRMKVDSVAGTIYVCVDSGWLSK